MSYTKSNFEGNFNNYVFCKTFWILSRAEKWMLGMATPIMRKNIKLFLMCGG